MSAPTIYPGTKTSIDPITMDDARIIFFDIESLHNIFTVATYDSLSHHVDVFYLLDHTTSPQITVLPHSMDYFDQTRSDAVMAAIIEQNPAFAEIKGSPITTADVALHNLGDTNANRRWQSNVLLARLLEGISVRGEVPEHQSHNHLAKQFAEATLVTRDFDVNYDPTSAHPFTAGFNSINYDTTLLSLYFAMLTSNIGSTPTYFPVITAQELRAHNDKLFSPEFIKNMPKYLWDRDSGAGLRAASGFRNAMLKSGRHIDIQRLNEKQLFVGLKRLLGLLGHQILESDRLSGDDAHVDTNEDVLDLIAYNVSDVVGTRLLAEDPVYSGSFDLRAGLLSTYPETVFDHDGIFRQPSTQMRKDRLTINTSSAQFAARILAPYRPLRDVPDAIGDMPVVSYLYPDAAVAEATGQKQVNVLDESKKFFYDNITDPEARAAFDEVFAFYADIEGRNFNSHNEAIDTQINQLRAYLNQVVAFDAAGYALYDVRTRFEQIFPKDRSYINDATDMTPRAVSSFDDLVALCDDIRGVLDRGLEISSPNHHEMVDAMRKQLHYIQAFYRAWGPIQRRFNDADPAVTHPHLTVIYPPLTPASAEKFNKITSVAAVSKRPTTLPYFRADGSPTRGFANFSTGGIHGAEYNEDRFDHDQDLHTVATREFFAILDATLAALYAAHQAEPESADYQIAQDALAWAKNVLSDQKLIAKSPQLYNPETGVTYEWEFVAQAAWWIRNKPVEVILPTGESMTVKHKSVLASASYPLRDNVAYWRSEPKTPQLFPVAKSGGSSLEKKYNYTSVGTAIHEDFSSYYPLLLTNMAAFTNADLGIDEKTGRPRDRYREIYEQKEIYGAQRKDPSIDEETKQRLGILREGTKLILNSATGAADAGHDTPILMNNRVIAMRIIGQLFSWRIGQAQSLAGATIISTNTDGLYSVLDMGTNQRVLDEHATAIGVQIEPEELDIVSKDSNSRAEFLGNGYINAAGDLACWDGPNSRNSLDHPAFVDHVLVKYFQLVVNNTVPEIPETPELEGVPLALDQPMNRHEVSKIVATMHKEFEPKKLLSFYQNILASSRGSNTFLFSVPYIPATEGEETHPATDTSTIATPTLSFDAYGNKAEVMPTQSTVDKRVPSLLQYYTRTFHVRQDTQQAVFDVIGANPVLIAAAKAASISPASADSRRKKGLASTNADPVAKHVLEIAGADVESLRHEKDLKVTKHTGQDPALPVVVFNQTIWHNPNDDVINALLGAIDQDAYIDMAISSYNKSWHNIIPA